MLSSKHCFDLIAEWRGELLGLGFDSVRKAERLRGFAASAGLDVEALTAPSIRRLNDRLDMLRAALNADRAEGADCHSRTDAWIARYLVVGGNELLCSEAVRKTRLARIRDRARRSSHTEKGMIASRVEMPRESWEQLQQMQKQLGTDSYGATISHLIARHDVAQLLAGEAAPNIRKNPLETKAPVNKKRPSRPQPGQAVLDLDPVDPPPQLGQAARRPHERGPAGGAAVVRTPIDPPALRAKGSGALRRPRRKLSATKQPAT